MFDLALVLAPPLPSSKSSASKTTPGESMMRSPRSSWTVWSSLVCPGCAATAHTLERLSELMSELLPTLGYPTMPTVILCAVGLYALSKRRRAGAVDEERLVRWWEEADLKGRVGVECRR
ncbi:hypothetical protein GSI_04468 [Ganoderma sinense ZZ0214-1]|uniref:Uncharacterized protein n=1 Tax=Ganoderma sinense ZZ0214-1 TaxID=1077348 RepID=A0A2G8SGW5_9APHY|nr:hypothetical protein GSI_04468 [Ganoderma sinense ZZ0214-1]